MRYLGGQDEIVPEAVTTLAGNNIAGKSFQARSCLNGGRELEMGYVARLHEAILGRIFQNGFYQRGHNDYPARKTAYGGYGRQEFYGKYELIEVILGYYYFCLFTDHLTIYNKPILFFRGLSVFR